MRVLIIEDEPTLADRIAEGLRDRGLAVDVAYDGSEGMSKATLNRYDVVLLDRDLPRVHGDAICAALAGSPSQSRILMLTASGEIEDRVEGLNLGADDYLPKPFAFAELAARIDALARRTPSAPPTLRHEDLVLDRARRVASRGGTKLALTRKEFAVLEVLLSAEGAVVSAEELFDRVWDELTDPFSNTVSVTIGRLRRKLGDPPLIETVIGSGYRI